MTPVNVPAPVVPYVPAMTPSTLKPKSTTKTPKPTRKNRRPPSADFSSFEEGSSEETDYEYDPGYKETDRIDVQTPLIIDPNAFVYSQNSAPYGQQYPSFVSDSIQTMVGTLGDDNKQFATSDHVVYGKFPEGSDASKNMNIVSEDNVEYYDDYYEDESYYYDEKALQGLKDRLGIAANGDQDTSETKMSFLQLINNLKGYKSSSSK